MHQFQNGYFGESQIWHFQSKSRVARESNETTYKEEKKLVWEIAVVCFGSTKRVESLFPFGSLETPFFQKLDWDIPDGKWEYPAMGKISL